MSGEPALSRLTHAMLKQRPLAEQLRYLARKLAGGTDPAWVAATLEMIASEQTEAKP